MIKTRSRSENPAVDEKLQKVVPQNPFEPTNQIGNAPIKLLLGNTDSDGY